MARKSGINMAKVHRFTRIIGGRNLRVMRPTFELWGKRYLSETKKEFVINSKGGGKWRPLKPATIAGRRKGKSGRRRNTTRGMGSVGGKVMILRDTGILFKALTIGQPGNLFKLIRKGIRVGFGGPSKHPDGKATIADIAKFHNIGKGKNPKRQILNKPSRALIAFMRISLGKAVDKVGNRT